MQALRAGLLQDGVEARGGRKAGQDVFAVFLSNRFDLRIAALVANFAALVTLPFVESFPEVFCRHGSLLLVAR